MLSDHGRGGEAGTVNTRTDKISDYLVTIVECKSSKGDRFFPRKLVETKNRAKRRVNIGLTSIKWSTHECSRYSVTAECIKQLYTTKFDNLSTSSVKIHT